MANWASEGFLMIGAELLAFVVHLYVYLVTSCQSCLDRADGITFCDTSSCSHHRSDVVSNARDDCVCCGCNE